MFAISCLTHSIDITSNAIKPLSQAFNSYVLTKQSFQDLYKWSVTQRLDFWADLFELHPLLHSGKYAQIVEPKRMDSRPIWFSGVTLNFAENILYSADPSDASRRTKTGKEDDKVACTEVREGCTEIKDITWAELRERVGKLAQAMKAHGVKKGDRVAVVASNSIDTLVVFLAVTTLAGLFSSSSTDMGTKGILDRLTQIRPKWVFVDDCAVYNGKTIDLREKMGEIVQGMEGVQEFQGLVSMPRWQNKPADIGKIPRTVTLAKYVEQAGGDSELPFEQADFCDPFLVVYSSGTTGVPKCIVHSIGGVLMNGKKEGKLHRDFGPESVNLQYTTVSNRILCLECKVSTDLHRPDGLCICSPLWPYSTALGRFFTMARLSCLT